jgi:hypothetical protein
LFGGMGLMAAFMIAEIAAHDSRLRLRNLDHVSSSAINPKWPVAMSLTP